MLIFKKKKIKNSSYIELIFGIILGSIFGLFISNFILVNPIKLKTYNISFENTIFKEMNFGFESNNVSINNFEFNYFTIRNSVYEQCKYQKIFATSDFFSGNNIQYNIINGYRNKISFKEYFSLYFTYFSITFDYDYNGHHFYGTYLEFYFFEEGDRFIDIKLKIYNDESTIGFLFYLDTTNIIIEKIQFRRTLENNVGTIDYIIFNIDNVKYNISGS